MLEAVTGRNRRSYNFSPEQQHHWYLSIRRVAINSCIHLQVSHFHEQGQAAWLKLLWGIKTGQPMFEAAFGKPMFEYLRDNPKEEALFSQAMSQLDHAGKLTSRL